MKILVISLISLMLAAASDPPAKSPLRSKPPLVEFQNGRLSVKATNVPLKELLSEMQKKSGIVVELKDTKAAERPFSIDLKSVLPTRAFEEVLRDLNYAFLYSGNRLSQVLILPPGVEISQRQVEKGPQPTKRFEGRLDRAEKGTIKAEREKALKQKTLDTRVQSKLAAIAELEDSDDPKSIAALGDMLADPSTEVKEAALSALTDKEDVLATQMIRRGLNDRTPEFRIEVLEALAERKDIESLRRGMADSNKDVRERAAELLEQSKP
jgi:HEAT repeats